MLQLYYFFSTSFLVESKAAFCTVEPTKSTKLFSFPKILGELKQLVALKT